MINIQVFNIHSKKQDDPKESSRLTQSNTRKTSEEKETKKESYLELTRHLTQNNARAQKGMLEALEDLPRFLQDYQSLFSQWFSSDLTIEELKAYRTWDLFCFVLYDAGYLGMTDFKAEADDFIYYIERILKNYGKELDYEQITDKKIAAPELFEQLKNALPEGFVLLDIVDGSDHYQLTVLPINSVEIIKEHLKKINGTIHWY